MEDPPLLPTVYTSASPLWVFDDRWAPRPPVPPLTVSLDGIDPSKFHDVFLVDGRLEIAETRSPQARLWRQQDRRLRKALGRSRREKLALCQDEFCTNLPVWSPFHGDSKFCSVKCRHADLTRLLDQLIATQKDRFPNL